MVITGEMPVSVNALSIAEPSTQSPNTVRRGDAGTVILVRTESGAVFRLFGLVLSSIHRVRYELHGVRGLLATAGPNHWSGVRVYHEDWLRESGQPHDMTYTADWPEHGDLARKSGHGGGDFWTSFHFAQAIRSGAQPYLNVYRGAAMAAVGDSGMALVPRGRAPRTRSRTSPMRRAVSSSRMTDGRPSRRMPGRDSLRPAFVGCSSHRTRSCARPVRCGGEL